MEPEVCFLIYAPFSGEKVIINRIESISRDDIHDLESILSEDLTPGEFITAKYESDLPRETLLKYRLDWKKFLLEVWDAEGGNTESDFLNSWRYGKYKISQEYASELAEIQSTTSSPKKIEKATKRFYSSFWNIVGLIKLTNHFVGRWSECETWDAPLPKTHFGNMTADILSYEWNRCLQASEALRYSTDYEKYSRWWKQIQEPYKTCLSIAQLLSPMPMLMKDKDPLWTDGQIREQQKFIQEFVNRIESSSKQSNSGSSSNQVPSWNRELGHLRLSGKTIRTITPRAKNVIPLLDAFEQAGWPQRIEDSFPNDEQGRNARREAIRTLNRGLAEIVFSADGSGTGTIWEMRGTLS